MKYVIVIFVVVILFLGLGHSITSIATISEPVLTQSWSIQSIDTMKYSRDLAREKMGDSSYDEDIEIQIKNIAKTGATHLAISTPYDNEFIPYLKRWVTFARKYNLRIWYRGNFSGWEKWFEYPQMTRTEHTDKIQIFILNNADLFEDGDIFVSCPECENGGPGDPRQTGDIKGFRAFLINEHKVVNDSFKSIQKNIITNLYSMNGDVAKIIMDERTTKQLGGTVTIDHYVTSPDTFMKDIDSFENESKGNIILGEWGAPIPDIHGDMSEDEQAEYVEKTLSKLLNKKGVIGMNYWTHIGSSTQLWNEDYQPRKVVEILTKYYKPTVVSGVIVDPRGNALHGVSIYYNEKKLQSDFEKFQLPIIEKTTLTFQKNGYEDVKLELVPNEKRIITRSIIMVKINNNFLNKLMDYFYLLINGKST